MIWDEFDLLQAKIIEGVYERHGWLPHHRGTFLLEGAVEQNPEKGFSFVVNRILDLREALAGAEVGAPRAVRAGIRWLRQGEEAVRRKAG